MCARGVSFLGVFLAASSLAAAEPTFEGTTVSQWVAQLQSPDIKERTSAAMALAELGAQGAPAVPALAKALEGVTTLAEVRKALAGV